MQNGTEPAGRPVLKHLLARPPVKMGMAIASASPVCAEICAGAGLDWMLIDAEHAPNTLSTLLAQLQAVQAYPVAPVIRPPVGTAEGIKQLLDIGAESLVIPMVESVEQAEAMVRAVRYPPRGVRGVGAAVARASRWNRTPSYLAGADDGITLLLQVESGEGLDQLEGIVAVDGVDGIFFGPSDLAAALGHLGQPDHPEVVEAIEKGIATVRNAGKACGVSSFNEQTMRSYVDVGATFALVGTDVGILVKGSDALVERFASSG